MIAPNSASRSAASYPFSLSLKARLSLLVLVMSLAGVWVFALAVAHYQEVQQQELLAAQQLSAVGYVAEDIDAKIRLRIDGLGMIAERFPRDALSNPRRTAAFLADRRAIYNLFDGGLIVVDPNGRRALADHPPMRDRLTRDFGDSAAIRDALAARKTVVGPPLREKGYGKPVITFAVPILDDKGKPLAVLAGVTSVDAPNLLDLVAKPRQAGQGDYLVVAPQHGVFVAGTDPAFMLKPLPPPNTNLMHDRYMAGHEGSGVAKNSRSIEELTSSRRIPSAGWFVVARLPTAEAFAPMRKSRNATLGGAALLSLLMSMLTLLALRRSLKPLEAAASEIRAMTRGEIPLHPLPAAGDDEIGTLVESFNHLQAQVQFKELELRESGATYRGIIDALGEAIYIQAEDGTILDINDGAVRMYGRPREAIVGGTPEPLSAPGRNDLAAVGKSFAAAFAGTPQQFEFWGLKADGSEFLKDVRFYSGHYFGRRVVIAVASDITARRQEEMGKRRAEQRLSTIFHVSPVPACIVHAADGRFIEANDALLRLLGRRREELIGRTSLEVGYWADTAARAVWLDALRRERTLQNHEIELRIPGDRSRNILMSSAFVELAEEPSIVSFMLDVTEERTAQRQLRLMAKVFSHSHEGMMITDEHGVIIDVNPAFAHYTGYGREEAVGRSPSFLHSGRHDAGFYDRMWASLRERGMWQGEIWNRKKDGELLAEMLTISIAPDEKGSGHRYIGIFTDITRLKATQAELEQMAHYDALTRLPNRALLRDRLVQAVAQAKRGRHLLGVCFLDLDGFKPVNDRHGHNAGDSLLVEVANRLQHTVRGEDTVARLGGDEFVVLLTQIKDLVELEAALQRLVRAIAPPCIWEGQELTVSASIGVTVYPHDGADPEALLRHADLAMYAAKQAGRNRFCFFDAGQDRQVREQYLFQERLRQALADGELLLYYQPKVHMRSGQVVGVEALIRWNHPEDGLKSPNQFLPFAEESELIVDIGNWTLREALHQLRKWRAQGLHLPVSVNIAARHLQRRDFVDRLASLLAEFPELPHHSLELEILETSALDDMDQARHIVAACDRLGVGFALDDFGTGYSSLVYLRNLPARSLKIDSGFVRDMGGDPHDLAIVEGVIGMGSAFGRTVIAEGVETDEQGQLLLQLGCEIAQGYGIARPMPGTAIIAWAAEYEPHASWQSDESVHWRREDFSLLAAEVDHRHWIERVIAAVEDGSGKATTPPLGERECRFGRWYHGEGRERYGHLPGYAEIEAMHAAVHATANEALRQARLGSQDDALVCTQTLSERRDGIVEMLRMLRRQVVSARRGKSMGVQFAAQT